jgi:hypothetical protein
MLFKIMAKRGYRTASEYASQAAARIQINDSGFIDIVRYFFNSKKLKLKEQGCARKHGIASQSGLFGLTLRAAGGGIGADERLSQIGNTEGKESNPEKSRNCPNATGEFERI